MENFPSRSYPTIGSEQGKKRPVLVISNESVNSVLPVLTVLPITSFKSGRKIYINESFIAASDTGLRKDSIVLCYQIRTIDKKRLIREIGRISGDKKKTEILDALKYQLDLESSD